MDIKVDKIGPAIGTADWLAKNINSVTINTQPLAGREAWVHYKNSVAVQHPLVVSDPVNPTGWKVIKLRETRLRPSYVPTPACYASLRALAFQVVALLDAEDAAELPVTFNLVSSR